VTGTTDRIARAEAFRPATTPGGGGRDRALQARGASSAPETTWSAP